MDSFGHVNGTKMREEDSVIGCHEARIGRMTSITLAILIIFIGATGNTLVCTAFAVSPKRLLRSSSNLIVGLSICDLLTCITVLPFDILYWIDFPDWTLGQFACKLWNCLFFVFLTISSLILVTVSLDIYYAIFKPLVYVNIITVRRCRAVLATVCVYGITIGVVFYFFHKDPPDNGCIFEIPKAMYGVYLVVHLAIPSLLVPFIYFKLFQVSVKHTLHDKKLKARTFSYAVRSYNPRRRRVYQQTHGHDQKSKRRQNAKDEYCLGEAIPVILNLKVEDLVRGYPYKGSKAEKSKLVKRARKKCIQGYLKASDELRLAKTFMMVTFGFLFFWIPFVTVQLLYVFDLQYKVNSCYLATADTIVSWLSYFQCCLNPVIYGLRHQRIRSILKAQFSRHWRASSL